MIPFCFGLAEWAKSTAKQANGNSDVFIAVKEGDLKALKELLIKKIVDIKKLDYHNYIFWHYIERRI